MCGPAALPIIAGAAAIVGATGQVVGGINANNQAKYEASVYRANASLDRKAAQDALERGQVEERRQYVKNAQLQGAQRAALAANGIQTDFGSAMDIQNDAKRIGLEDANTIRQNATREMMGYEISAFNNDAGSTGAKARGKSALIGSVFDAGSTLLGGAKQVGQLKASGRGV